MCEEWVDEKCVCHRGRRRYGRTLANFFNLYRSRADTVLLENNPMLINNISQGNSLLTRLDHLVAESEEMRVLVGQTS